MDGSHSICMTATLDTPRLRLFLAKLSIPPRDIIQVGPHQRGRLTLTIEAGLSVRVNEL